MAFAAGCRNDYHIEMVKRAIYAALNATMQMDGMHMGEITFLSDEEAMKGMDIMENRGEADSSITRGRLGRTMHVDIAAVMREAAHVCRNGEG
jgi:hypothetical protein